MIEKNVSSANGKKRRERNSRLCSKNQVATDKQRKAAVNHKSGEKSAYKIESNAFDLCNPNENIDEKLAHINSLLDSHNDKISVMLVWGSDERVEAVLKKWFEDKPFFQNERVRLFRRR